MIKILFTLYWGHLKRYRWQFILIMVGLILGLSTGVLSFLYNYDLSYDHHYPDYERIYKLYRKEIAESGKSVISSAVPIFLKSRIEDQFPEIEIMTRINPNKKIDLKTDPNEYSAGFEERIANVIASDTNFFKVFPQKFIQGSSESALKNPYSLVITEKFSEKYFGTESAMGEHLTLNKMDFTITGIIENLPGNTHVQFEGISSSLLSGIPAGYLFMKIKQNTDFELFSEKMSDFFEDNPIAQSLSSADRVEPVLLPLKEIHWANHTIDSYKTEHKYYVWAISLIGIFVILICLFNFATILSSQGALRGKELGIKRVLGENKAGLFKSLFFETSLTVAVGIILSLLCIEMILPVFNQLADKNITESHLYSPSGIVFIIGIWIFISFCSGILPAMQYSRITVSETVKGMNEKPAKSPITQIALLLFQFTISFVVILVTVFISGQIRLTKKMDLGFNKENVIMLNNRDIGFEQQYEAMRSELLQYPDIVGVTTALNFPKRGTVNEDIFIETNEGRQSMFTGKMWVGKDYLDVMGFTLLEGKTLSADIPEGVIVNQTFARLLGEEDIFGSKVYNNDGEYFGKITGVVKDFNLYSLHREIGPIILIDQGDYQSGRIHIRFQGKEVNKILAHIEELWNEFYPEDPFIYYFLDEDLATYYHEDRIHSGFLWGSSIVAFILGILGLFAMTAFDVQQKRKSLALQRVFGANYTNLLENLSKQKLILLLIAFAIGLCISLLIYYKWVQNFAYHAPVNPVGILLVFIAISIAYILTVMRLVWVVNSKPPMDTLRIE